MTVHQRPHGTRFDRLRGQAISVLGQAMTGQATPAELLDRGNLAGMERAWVLEVVQGVLRTRGRLEGVLAGLALKKSPTGWLKRALWVGGYSLMYQDRTAPEMVVSEIVDLIRSKEGNAPAAFANAVLRKWAEHASEFRELPYPTDASAAEQARWASLPEWWWSEWVKQFGREKAIEIVQAALARPQLWLRARPEAMEELLTQGFERVAGVRGALAPSASLASGDKPMAEWPGYSSGQWIVQDLSSQMIIEAVAEELGPDILRAEGWDMCASPGGKTIALAWERGKHSAGRLWASDLPDRVGLLKNNLARTAMEADVSIHEALAETLPLGAESARALPQFESKPAWVWLDAPCTSSGLIRRHPEVRWQLRQDDRDRLHERQAQLLRRAIATGAGSIVYSVCSLFASEGEKRVTAVLKEFPGATIRRQWSLPITERHDGFWAAIISTG